MSSARFLSRFKENSNFNQYWYSSKTIEVFLRELKSAERVACVCCPSIYYSLPKEIQEVSYLFDLDTKFAKNNDRFVCYDLLNHSVPPEATPCFDFIFVDPPFVTEDVLTKVASYVHHLCHDRTRILITTIAENKDFVYTLFKQAVPQAFKPSVPNLIYQFDCFVNYESSNLCYVNDELV
ncbi:hypothetical protein RCL1_001776 [Eukaryota sp. TZLM3-RCL]